MTDRFLCAEVIWRIENFTCCFHGVKEPLFSAEFTVDSLDKSAWFLSIYPKGYDTTQDIAFFLKRSKNDTAKENIIVKYKLAFLDVNDVSQYEVEVRTHAFPRGQIWGCHSFIKHAELYHASGRYLPGDVLSIRCKMWTADDSIVDQIARVSLRTRIPVKKYLFGWNIPRFSSMSPDDNSKSMRFDSLFDSGKSIVVSLSYVTYSGEKYLKVEVFGDYEGKCLLRCNLRVMRTRDNFLLSESKVSSLPFKEFFQPLIYQQQIIGNADRFLLNDTLVLRCELNVISYDLIHSMDLLPLRKSIPPTISYQPLLTKSNTFAAFNSDNEMNEPIYSNSLGQDFLRMFREGILSDFCIQVGQQIFRVHMAVLATRSPVLHRMLESNMKEKNDRILILNDIDVDVVRRLLDFIYSNDPGELNVESALQLYYAGDKYEITGLKSKATTFLMQNISHSNVCQVLILADQHNDDELMSWAIQYIFLHEKEIVLSQEFKTFLHSHARLGGEVFLKLSEMRLQ